MSYDGYEVYEVTADNNDGTRDYYVVVAVSKDVAIKAAQSEHDNKSATFTAHHLHNIDAIVV